MAPKHQHHTMHHGKHLDLPDGRDIGSSGLSEDPEQFAQPT
jgi:hypothetical protein